MIPPRKGHFVHYSPLHFTNSCKIYERDHKGHFVPYLIVIFIWGTIGDTIVFLPHRRRFFPVGSVCALHSFNRRFRRLAVFVVRLLVLLRRHHFFLSVSCQRVNIFFTFYRRVNLDQTFFTCAYEPSLLTS